SDQQNCGCVIEIPHRTRHYRGFVYGSGKSREVGCPVVVDVICSEHQSRKLLQEIVFFVGCSGRSYDPNLAPVSGIHDICESRRNRSECLFPRGWYQTAILANQGLIQPVLVVSEVEGVTTLDAQKVSVDPTLITVVASNNFHACVGPTDAKSSLATIGTVGTGCVDVNHLPRPRLVSIGTRGQRPNGADVDTHPAFFAVQMISLVGSDDGGYATVLDAKGPDIHGLTANSNAAVTKNAPRPIKIHNWGPLLFFAVILWFHVLGFCGAVRKS